MLLLSQQRVPQSQRQRQEQSSFGYDQTKPSKQIYALVVSTNILLIGACVHVELRCRLKTVYGSGAEAAKYSASYSLDLGFLSTSIHYAALNPQPGPQAASHRILQLVGLQHSSSGEGESCCRI